MKRIQPIYLFIIAIVMTNYSCNSTHSKQPKIQVSASDSIEEEAKWLMYVFNSVNDSLFCKCGTKYKGVCYLSSDVILSEKQKNGDTTNFIFNFKFNECNECYSLPVYIYGICYINKSHFYPLIDHARLSNSFNRDSMLINIQDKEVTLLNKVLKYKGAINPWLKSKLSQKFFLVIK